MSTEIVVDFNEPIVRYFTDYTFATYNGEIVCSYWRCTNGIMKGCDADCEGGFQQFFNYGQLDGLTLQQAIERCNRLVEIANPELPPFTLNIINKNPQP